MVRAIISVDYYSNTYDNGTVFVQTECSMVISTSAERLAEAVNSAVAQRAMSFYERDVGMYGRVLSVTIVPNEDALD